MDPTRWLLLIHQIPPKPAYLRVKIGRRLQKLGAVAIKNSVYVLPRGDHSFEDFQWVVREIRESRGDASVCEGRFVDGLSDAEVEGLFNRARAADYAALAGEAKALQAAVKKARGRLAERRDELEPALAKLRRRVEEVARLDFFGAPGRAQVEAVLIGVEERLRQAVQPASTTATSGGDPAPRRRTWVTRKGIHVDRMASAWLIKRFIDPEAVFKFVPGNGYAPEPGELRFDMFEAEYTHEGDACTFEVLLRRFALTEPALQRIGEIVHDIDLKDGKFNREDTPGVEHLVAGIAIGTKEDEARLAQGADLFNGLFEYHRRKTR